MRIYRPYVIACAVSIAIGAAMTPSAQAQTTSRPGWGITAVLRNCGDDSLEAVTAAGIDDAWAIGALNSGDGGPACYADIEHWNGKRWHRVRTPRDVGVGVFLPFSFPLAA